MIEMTEKRYVEELWAYDDIMVKDNETGEELWNNMIYERMNEQDKMIKKLEKENRGLQFKIIDMLDFVKEKGTVTREEIKKWWNGDVE